MRIAVAFKAVPDAQDVQVAGDRTLDFSKAKLTISEYDKNALELGAQLADEAVAITVGGKDIDNSKLKKDVMARGMGHLYMAADDALADLDAAATAAALADVLAKAGDVDAVISVTPDVAEPRIPGMKDILAAGKKPMDVAGADNAPAAALTTVECLAPEQVARKQEIVDAADDGATEKLAAAVKAAL